MKHLWQLPASLQHLVEKRWGADRRRGDRRQGRSLLFNWFGIRDRRIANRRDQPRRAEDRGQANRTGPSIDDSPPTAGDNR